MVVLHFNKVEFVLFFVQWTFESDYVLMQEKYDENLVCLYILWCLLALSS